MADLVRRQVAVIATAGNVPTLAAKAATATIPIVFGVGDDPIRLGLVASFARPGGNLTGINFFNVELVAKRLALLRELVPRASRVAVLLNPPNAASLERTRKDVETAARDMGLQIQVLDASTSREIDAALATFVPERPDGLFVSSDPFFTSRRVQLANLAAHHSVPMTSATREIVEVGGLMSYGSNIADAFRQVGVYAQGCQAGGIAGRAGEQVRVGHQRLDRQDARPHGAAQTARGRRRVDRITRAALLHCICRLMAPPQKN
jgi:putative ABC transport system substrate-binding protein